MCGLKPQSLFSICWGTELNITGSGTKWRPITQGPLGRSSVAERGFCPFELGRSSGTERGFCPFELGSGFFIHAREALDHIYTCFD